MSCFRMHRDIVIHSVRTLVLLALVSNSPGADLPWVRLDHDGRSFVLEPSGQKFIPWGFNYDHDRSGRLIEDYWDDEWATIAEDFHEMKIGRASWRKRE